MVQGSHQTKHSPHCLWVVAVGLRVMAVGLRPSAKAVVPVDGPLGGDGGGGLLARANVATSRRSMTENPTAVRLSGVERRGERRAPPCERCQPTGTETGHADKRLKLLSLCGFHFCMGPGVPTCQRACMHMCHVHGRDQHGGRRILTSTAGP